MKIAMIKTAQLGAVILWKRCFIRLKNMGHRPGRNYDLSLKSLIPEQDC